MKQRRNAVPGCFGSLPEIIPTILSLTNVGLSIEVIYPMYRMTFASTTIKKEIYAPDCSVAIMLLYLKSNFLSAFFVLIFEGAI